MDRLQLEPSDRETVIFLIASHLEISSVLRRDIYDPATIQAFSDKIGTPERLKMLCLLTYADIKAVNPEALTPWKAENVWQLYIGASNSMSRTADQRVHADSDKDETISRLQTIRRNRPGRYASSWKACRNAICALTVRKRFFGTLSWLASCQRIPSSCTLNVAATGSN